MYNVLDTHVHDIFYMLHLLPYISCYVLEIWITIPLGQCKVLLVQCKVPLGQCKVFLFFLET